MSVSEATSVETVVVGASAAGLAVGACLKRAGMDFVLLEQEDRVAGAWRRHYDRLHLHTNRRLSGLPYLPMPGSYPKYPSRDQVVEYLEAYRAEMGLEPRYGERVTSIERLDDAWLTTTPNAAWRSRNVVVASGYTREPVVPEWPGRETFMGTVIHSSEYANGGPFAGRRVLVVGFGNSGGEIAIDLADHGAEVSISVRSAVNVVPRDLLGIPILAWGLALGLLPMRWADVVSKPLLRASIGDLGKLGLRELPYGPNTQIRRHGRIPLLDIGTLRRVREGRIRVRPGIARFTSRGVVFDDGAQEGVEAVVLATGYRPAIGGILRGADGALDARGVPSVSGRRTGTPGLYFCGFHVSPTGMLREIGIEARRIARALVREREGGTGGGAARR